MGEVLSQNEIDNLLKQLSSGELDVDEYSDEPAQKIVDYDFKRPTKFSKEHLRTLEIIFEHFGRLVSTNLPAYLRKNVQMEVVNAEAVTYSEFSNSLSNPVLIGIVNVEPLNGNIIMEIASNLGFSIVDRMLGGTGEPLEKVRDYSEIELGILERIFTICINMLQEPWKNVVEIEPRLERIETNSQFVQIISPSEMIAIVTINMKIGEVVGLMNICLPFLTLEDVMDKLNTKYWYASMENSEGNAYFDVIETAIAKAQIPIRAVLGNSTISVNDFVNLQKGDIIKINRQYDAELDIFVGNMLKFKALPGSASEDYAVKITKVIREE